MRLPQLLKPADKVAIVSPSGAVRPEYVSGMVETLRKLGLSPVVMPSALERSGTYAGSADMRFNDMVTALLSKDIRAIFCTRGGFGAVALLQRLNRLPIRENDKWLVGFSDISALHALWYSHRVESIHGPMGRYLSHLPVDSAPVEALKRQLFEGRDELTFDPHPLDRCGRGEGILAGGNLAVLTSLMGTPYSMLQPNTIMVIEDINEPLYKIERMLWQLRLAGVLENLNGLIVGKFTGTEPDANHRSVEELVAEMTAPYSYPVAYDAPIGHFEGNMPVILGSRATLVVEPAAPVTLTMN